MKKFILLLVFFFLSFFSFNSFSQNLDDISGDYILASSNKIVSLDLQDALLVDVAKMLSTQTGLNFVSTEAVKDRKVTLYLEKVPLKEAIDIIFKANNLTYDYYPDANIFVIKEMGKPSIELKTKVYTLKYVRVRYSRLQKEIIDRIEVQQKGGLQPTTQQATTTTTTATTGEEKEEDRGIKGAVKKVLTEFGKVTEDPITNSLIVTDVPSQFPVIDELINKLDIPLPLVMIETEMLDVSKRAIDKLGVNWPDSLITLGVTGTKGVSFPFPGSTEAMDNNFIKYEKGIFSDSKIASGLEITNWPLTNFTPTILTVIGADLVLNYLKSLTDTKSLARPKIMTLANEAAEIKIVTNEAIGVTKSEQTTAGGTTTYTIEREETGTRLRVTPQVDVITGEITLFVEMVVKDTTDSGFTFASTTFVTGTIQNPQERSATAVARLKDGETLLLGGLIKRDTSQQKTKLPVLGDIPFLRNFFRYKYKDNTERELLVFLTPRIVRTQRSNLEREIITSREQASFKQESVRIALDKYSKIY